MHERLHKQSNPPPHTTTTSVCVLCVVCLPPDLRRVVHIAEDVPMFVMLHTGENGLHPPLVAISNGALRAVFSFVQLPWRLYCMVQWWF